MTSQRIEIIIKEINYWKEHKLLPEVYCNFLLALYTKGENKADMTYNAEVKSRGISATFSFTGQFLLLLLSVIVINMDQITPFLQFTFLFLIFIGVFWLFMILNKQRDIYFHLSTIILLVAILLITVFIVNQYFMNHWIFNTIMIGNFICWFVVGHKYRLKYLLVISVMLMIIIMFYTFLYR